MSYIGSREKTFDTMFFVRALPNEYLVLVGKKRVQYSLGGTAFRPFRKHLKVPASAEIISFDLECSTSNYLGVIVSGYVAWKIDPTNVETAIRSLDFYNADNPLEKTSGLICDMAKDAVRRSIAEIKVDEILKSCDKLKASIEGILKDVEKWGLVVDTIGINKIFIKSENIYNDLQMHDRDKLRLISETSNQETTSKITQNDLEQRKEIRLQESILSETEIQEDLKKQKMIEESEIEKMRLAKEKEKEELKLSQEIETARFNYQKERMNHDRELQLIRYEMEMKNLDIIERKRLVEGGMTDRELAELLTQKLEKVTSMYKNANLTVIGDKADAMGSIITPIKVIGDLVKDFLSKDKKISGKAEENHNL